MTFLQVLWFILIAVLWTGYLFLEGFSLGIGMTLPFVAKNDKERTQVIRTVGPVWDANEVWLLTAGGATFAAFPEWYATMFSGMYLALFLILVCLILRISAVEWRAKVASEKWRARWDVMHVVAAWLVPILFGVAFANPGCGSEESARRCKPGRCDPGSTTDPRSQLDRRLLLASHSVHHPWRPNARCGVVRTCDPVRSAEDHRHRVRPLQGSV